MPVQGLNTFHLPLSLSLARSPLSFEILLLVVSLVVSNLTLKLENLSGV